MTRPASLISLAFGLLLTMVVVAAGCGGGGGASPRPSEVPEGAAFIDQDRLKFNPSTLTVKAGEKVYFANSETALHTVSIEGKNESGPMRRGDIFEFTFANPGSYRITCDYHPQMRATVTVE